MAMLTAVISLNNDSDRFCSSVDIDFRNDARCKEQSIMEPAARLI